MKGSAYPVHVKPKVYTSVIVWGQSQLCFQVPCSRHAGDREELALLSPHQSLPSISTKGNSWNLSKNSTFRFLQNQGEGSDTFPLTSSLLSILHMSREEHSICTPRLDASTGLCQCWNLNELGPRPSAPEGLCGGAWGHLVNQGLLGTDLWRTHSCSHSYPLLTALFSTGLCPVLGLLPRP